MRSLKIQVINKLKIYLKLIAIISPILIAIVSSYIVSFKYTKESDFCQDYYSARHIVNGLSPYTELDCWGYVYPFNIELNPHPPFSIYMFIPFLLLDLRTSAFIWGILSAFFFFFALFLILKILNKATLFNLALLFGMNIFSYAFYKAFADQNIFQFLFFIITCAWYFSLKKRYYFSGFLIGFATLLRFWPFLFLLPFLFIKNNKVIIAAALTIMAGTLITLMVNGLQDYVHYFGPVQSHENNYIMHITNISLISFLARLFVILGLNQDISILMAKIIGVFVFLSLLVYSHQLSKRNLHHESVFNLNIAISLSLLYFIFPVLWEWGLILQILIAAIMYYSIQKSKYKIRNWRFILGLVFILLFPLRIMLNYMSPVNDLDYILILIFNNISLLIVICLILFLQFGLLNYLHNKR